MWSHSYKIQVRAHTYTDTLTPHMHMALVHTQTHTHSPTAYLNKALAYPDQYDTAVVAAGGGWNQHVKRGRGHDGKAKHSGAQKHKKAASHRMPDKPQQQESDQIETLHLKPVAIKLQTC